MLFSVRLRVASVISARLAMRAVDFQQVAHAGGPHLIGAGVLPRTLNLGALVSKAGAGDF